MTMIYGFIGTGTITAAMVEGILSSRLPVSRVLVSPRNADVASCLATRFSKVQVALSNQAVADEADVLVLAVRPQIAPEVLSSISFPTGRVIISVIAATSQEKLSEWTKYMGAEIVRAVPLPFVAEMKGVTAMFPANATASNLFDAIGETVECENQEEFDVLTAASALMGTYYGVMGKVSDWMVAQGMSEVKARNYLTPLFGSLSHVAARSPKAEYVQLRNEFSTKGGLNEQVFQDFENKGGSKALVEAMDAVLLRIRT